MRVYGADALPGVAGTARFVWAAPAAWYEEDEQVFVHLQHTLTQTACPYKGLTSDYWSVRVNGIVEEGNRDPVWSYQFRPPRCCPSPDWSAFYNEKADLFVDGALQARPHTHLAR